MIGWRVSESAVLMIGGDLSLKYDELSQVLINAHLGYTAHNAWQNL